MMHDLATQAHDNDDDDDDDDNYDLIKTAVMPLHHR